MRKHLLLTLVALALTLPSFADDDRHQSYISYDDGGTIVKSGEDAREIEARRNLPVYPGDEIITARRGRAEVRLSDGNIIGIDRTTALRLRSMVDSYEGESDETVVELRYGKVAVHRTDLGQDHVRLDTENASYVADHETVYSVEASSGGRDRLTVFDGSLEVRTRSRATRLRSGESATIDDSGVYDLVGDQRDAADDFEQWFLRRAERFEKSTSRYVDRKLGYWADDLDDNGRWVFVTGIGWSWRPFVAVGWRPYYNGYWYHSPYGSLTWVSYDPWGWGPYHYGRWAYDAGYGWVWAPGYGYSPAWVYWMYGPSYVGWAPAGWWDCYRPYYGWAYGPYRNAGISYQNFGFWGRVRVNEFDLRPWTFVDSGALVSNRVDRVAMTTTLIKDRMSRTRDGVATISGGAARFTREEFRDPADAIRRRGLDGRLTGRETGAPPADLTPFLRRDSDVGGAIRDRFVRGRDGGSTTPVAGGVAATPSRGAGGLAPIGRGSVAPIGGGGVAPITGGSPSPIAGADRRDGDQTGGRVNRGTPAEDPVRVIGGERGSGPRDRGTADTSPWGDRLRDRPVTPPAASTPSSTPDRVERVPASRNDSWRSRVRSDDGSRGESTPSASPDRSAGTSSDVPRRVIDRIGGARVVPRESDGGSGSRSTTRERSSSSPPRDRPAVRDSGSRERTPPPRDSGGSRESARPRDSGSSGSSGSSTKSSGGSSAPRSSGGGGRIRRDQ